ncbi:MAG: DUF2079 domain-containing protein [Chloroflexota bacterium]
MTFRDGLTRFPWLVPLAAGALWTVTAAWSSIREHETFNSTSRDLAVYVQVLWNTAHGRPYQTTVLEANRIHLAEHFAPALAALAPAYALLPGPRWLFLFQTMALAGSGVPVYLLARERIGGVLAPALLLVGFFAMPMLVEVAFDAFYPVTLSALPLAWAAYFAIRGRVRPALALGLVAMLVEEQGAFGAFGLGLYFAAWRRDPRRGLLILAPAALWLVVIPLVVMPKFHEPTTAPTAAPNRALDLFSPLMSRPSELLREVTNERVPRAVRWWLLPTGGLALLSPESLLVSAPHAATLLLADREGRFRRHWGAPLVPVLWLATTVALGRMRSPTVRTGALGLMLVGATVAYVLDSGLPGGGDYEPQDVEWSERAAELQYGVGIVDRDAPVVASRRALGQLANRSELYVYPPSYGGRLWPPERRPQAYVLDLTNEQTRRELGERESPLRQPRSMSVVVVGTGAVVALEGTRAPVVPTDVDVGPFRLVGYDVEGHGADAHVRLHWRVMARPPDGSSRVVRLVPPSGSPTGESVSQLIGSALPSNEWRTEHTLIDRVAVPGVSGSGWLLEVSWVAGGAALGSARLPLELSSPK